MIEAMLVLSTAHLTDATCNTYLATDGVFACLKQDYGWFVHVADDAPADLPTDLEACFHLARSQGCDWIMFDRDAPAIEQLPEFVW